MPSAVAPMVTATSPVTTPTRIASPGTPTSSPKRGDRLHELEPGPYRALGVVPGATGTPHTAITASPMNFSTVPP